MNTPLLRASTLINVDHSTPPLLIDFKQTSVKVRMGRSRIYALIGEGSFPAPVKIGTSSRWIAHEIDAYIEQLAAARNSQLLGA
jgi:prophage regulatory protein